MFKKQELRIASFVVLGVFGISSGALAFEVSQRASQQMRKTKPSVAVAPGQLELKMGLDYTRHIGEPQFDNNWGTTNRPKMRLWDWRATATYGVTDGMDVFVSTGWFDIKDRAMPGAAGIDKYGRGLNDVSVGITKELQSTVEHITIAYVPELAIPIGREAEKGGRLGLGRDFWEFKQTLAATVETQPVRVNTNVSHSIPFGRTRSYYATPYMMPRKEVRGITELGTEALVKIDGPVQPMANLNYSHQWISNGNDSDLITAGLGAKVQVGAGSQLVVGYDYPVAGRNSLRGQSWNVAWIGEF